MPYRALPLKPTAGQPWRDFGDSVYDNVAQFLTDLPALKADIANVAAQATALAQFRIDSMVVPTVLYGRHPGWGIPRKCRFAEKQALSVRAGRALQRTSPFAD